MILAIHDQPESYAMSSIATLPVITPVDDNASTHRTGTLENVTFRDINAALGFEPNHEDDPDKVGRSWAFTVDGARCAVWSYKGSGRLGYFSTFGPHDKLRAVFGAAYVEW